MKHKLTCGAWEYTALWQVAQRPTDRPVKFGAICAPALASMLWNEFYVDDKAMILDLCDIMNAELRELFAENSHDREHADMLSYGCSRWRH